MLVKVFFDRYKKKRFILRHTLKFSAVKYPLLFTSNFSKICTTRVSREGEGGRERRGGRVEVGVGRGGGGEG